MEKVHTVTQQMIASELYNQLCTDLISSMEGGWGGVDLTNMDLAPPHTSLNTWEQLPLTIYVEVLKSGQRTANVCSSIRTYFSWIKTTHGSSSVSSMAAFWSSCCIVAIQLLTLAVLWPLFVFVIKNSGSFMALFEVVEISSQKCKPWQFYGN